MPNTKNYIKKDKGPQEREDRERVREAKIIKFPRLQDYVELGLRESITELLLSKKSLPEIVQEILEQFAKQEVLFAKYLSARIDEILDEFNASSQLFQRRFSKFDIQQFHKHEQSQKERIANLERRMLDLEDLVLPPKPENGESGS